MAEVMFITAVVVLGIYATMICDTIRSSTDRIVRAIESTSQNGGEKK